MQPTSVFAAASSRLHADLIVIRLRRAGISPHLISAIFRERSAPNCAVCWLEGVSKPATYSGESVAIAGPMRKKLSLDSEAALVEGLESIGLGAREATAFAERLGQGQILIAVHTDDQSEIAIAWHTFRELEADGIALGLSEKSSRSSWFTRKPGRKADDSAAAALSLGLAT